MSLDALRDALPAYAKDLSLNLSSLSSETTLSDQQKWGTFLASAYATGQPSCRPRRAPPPRPRPPSWA